MPQVTLLGSCATLAGPDNDTIYLLIRSEDGDYLIDCGGSPSHKLARVGAELWRLRGVLLTHDHADHIYGLPLLVQSLMLSDWSEQGAGELIFWGLTETLATAKVLLEVFDLADRIPLSFRPLPPQQGFLVLDAVDLRILTTPVKHIRPTLGVRVEGKKGGRVLVYSSDTEPCRAAQQLAAGADFLLHEATVQQPMAGHSTPAQAGSVAAAAGVKQLVLVHYEPARDRAALLAEAADAFGGPVQLGQDWTTFKL